MSSAADQADEPVFQYLRMQAGLSPTSLRRNGATSAVSRLQNRLNVGDQHELVRRLSRETDLFDALIAEVTIGETHFFRHEAQLAAIRTDILPTLSRERSANHIFRIWSAGCATGEEAYTLAILADEEGLAGRTSILATDISKPALLKARKGEYSSWSFRGLEKSFITQHFDMNGPVARVRKEIRDRVDFRVLNLALDDYPSLKTGTTGLDLILCRNVLIYFDSDAVADTASRLYACLAPGGWLVMGPSDPPLWNHVPLTPILLPGGVLYRRDSNEAVPAPPSQSTNKRAATSASRRPAGRRATAQRPPAPEVPAQLSAISAAAGDPGVCHDILEVARSEGVTKAENLAAALLMQEPLDKELRYLRCVLLMSLNEDNEAIAELRRLIYLDKSQPAVHFTLGTLFYKKRDDARAGRSFTNAFRLATTLPPDQIVPLAEGMTAAKLGSLAKERILELSAKPVAASSD